PLAAELPILLACTARPDPGTPAWTVLGAARERFGDALVRVDLRPLAEEDGASLLAKLLADDAPPAELQAAVLPRSQGNPLFIEELVRALVDRGAMVRVDGAWTMTGELHGLEIPETLQGLLAARIDRLPPPVRRVLAVAAVIGRDFDRSLLGAAVD